MIRALLIAMLLCLTAASEVAPPVPWPAERFIAWQPAWGARTIDTAGVSLQIESRECGDRGPVSEACYPPSRYTVVKVTAPGMQPVTIDGGAGAASYVGVGKLGPRATRPSVVLITDDGGSSGCGQIDIASPNGSRYRGVRLSITPQDHGTLCELDPQTLAWPRDLTGHGRAEFLMVDDRWQCTFTSCAGSWYPPRVVAFDGTRGLDVSSDPALAALFLADMHRARHACENPPHESQGACAGFAADAARVGELDNALTVIRAQVRRGCRIPVSERVPVTGECYSDAQIPAEFETELMAALRRTGYVH